MATRLIISHECINTDIIQFSSVFIWKKVINKLEVHSVNLWKLDWLILNISAMRMYNTFFLDNHIVSDWHIPSSSFCRPTAETCLARGIGVPFCYGQRTSSQCVDQRNVSLTDPRQLVPVVAA